MTVSNEMASNVSDSIDKIAKSFHLFSDIVDLKGFFILLRHEKDFSEDVIVIATVLKILKAKSTFGNIPYVITISRENYRILI